jgi:hypothetical protein
MGQCNDSHPKLYAMIISNDYLDTKITNLCRILGSHSGGYEEFCLLRYNAMQSIESQPTFLQCRRINQRVNRYEAGGKQSWYFVWLHLQP